MVPPLGIILAHADLSEVFSPYPSDLRPAARATASVQSLDFVSADPEENEDQSIGGNGNSNARAQAPKARVDLGAVNRST